MRNIIINQEDNELPDIPDQYHNINMIFFITGRVYSNRTEKILVINTFDDFLFIKIDYSNI